MFRLMRLAMPLLLAQQVPGWWGTSETSRPHLRDDQPWTSWDYASWAINRTRDGNFTLNDFAPWGTVGWDSWLWTAFDSVIGVLGWLIFGNSWTQVRNGFSLVIRLTVILGICVVAHYFFALCWPVVSLIMGIVLTVVWIVRSLVKCLGRVIFYTQRACGGVPEAVGAEFFGPETGEVPETAELRRLKKGNDGERWILIRRDGLTAVMKVQEASSIKSTGLFITYEPDSLRGDSGLVHALHGHDKVHLCRASSCTEDGQHFKQYSVVKNLGAEKFQLAHASAEAQQAGARFCTWFGKKAVKAARKAKDFASESEQDGVPCQAHSVVWNDESGRHRLADAQCTDVGSAETVLLDEDSVGGSCSMALCPNHARKYLASRFQQKCGVAGCNRFGDVSATGLRLCVSHGEGSRTSSTRRSSRSRSRVRDPVDDDADEEPRGGIRRRVRHEGDEEMEDPGDLISHIRGSEVTKPARTRRRQTDASPGCTPKSQVQRSLAKLGMVNSPDRREMQSTLEEFMERLLDGKDLGLDEEDVKGQMAAGYGLSVLDLTKMLYEQGVEEQRKGTKGLTKFLGKWRKQVAVDTPDRSRASSWSLVGTPPEALPTPAEVSPEGSEALKSSVGPSVSERKCVVLPPPGIYAREDRKAGTGGEENQMTDLARAIQHQTSELATLVKAQQETNVGQVGTMRSLQKTSEELVYLLRACGQYTVEVGAEEYGANLANALLSAQAGASTKLRGAGFRQKVTPRLAIGLAGPFWGTQDKHALSAADFVAFTDAELDNYAVESRTGKQANDQRPPMPNRFEDWIQRVRRQNDVWALVYGKEWKGVRDHAVGLLETWHIQAPHKWPLQVLVDVWEELHWRFVEELKAELRKIKAMSGRETMTLTDLKFYALMPDEHGNPPLQLPRTFDLENPEGWFMTEVRPRIERRQERLLWKLTWEGAGKTRGPGQTAGASAGSSGPGDRGSQKSLLGPKLTAEETNRAKDRAPVDRDGKLLCWGYITHAGCQVSGCQRSHENLRGTFEALDPAVRMQLLRRGGLKRMKMETAETAAEKIKELRAHVVQDKAAKVKDGQDRKKASQEPSTGTTEPGNGPREGRAGATWKVPAEMEQVDYTAQEQDFIDLVKGPSQKILSHIPTVSRPHAGRDGETAPDEVKKLLAEAQKLADGPVLGALKDASDDLYAWASTRVANQPSISLTQLLGDMTQYGLGELAEEAASILERHSDEKAGNSRRCRVGDTHWDDGGFGRAQVDIDGKAWMMLDYKEEIMMTEELAGLLGVVAPEVEKRQCVTKVLAAGQLHLESGRLPGMDEVEHRAQEIRLEQARQAADAEGIMGHPEPKVSAIEHELRMYAHDILKAHHDKDYRAMAVFPVEALGVYRLVTLRLDYKGDVIVEHILGNQWKEGQPTLWTLIWKGHMTLLVPPSEQVAKEFLKQQEVVTTPSLGFHYFWHQRHDQPRTSPGIVPCRHCKPLKKAGSAEADLVLRKSSCLPGLAMVVAGGRVDPKQISSATTPAGPTGLVLQEFFAGKGVITHGWLAAGEVALDPVELYEDPHRQQGRRAHYDLADPQVQERYLQEIDQDKFNVEWIACPCTTFCDWNLQNRGTRTFEEPMGKPTEKEANGNNLSTFGAVAFEKALTRGHFPIAESSGLSGRYPKQWHLPVWRRLLQRPDVDFLEVDMCAYGLGPVDCAAGTSFYRHRTGLAFPRHPGFRLALSRLCPGISASHQHVPLQGARPGTDVTRCTEAGVYAPNFVRAVVEALQTFVTGGGRPVPRPLEKASAYRAGGQIM